MKPRSYQWEAVVALWKYFQENQKGNPLVVLPTGTGKSGVIAFFIRSVVEQFINQRIMLVTHVKELIEQDYNTLMRVWPTAPAGIHSSGLKRKDMMQNVIFAGIGSVAKKADLFPVMDLIIIDEAHLVSPNDNTMYRKFINEMLERNPRLRVIGLTATAFRVGQGLLIEGDNALFNDICFDMSSMEQFNWFINEGYLCQLIPKKMKLTLDVSKVGTSQGDFKLNDLQSAVNKQEITEAALRETMEVGHERRSWLIFTSGVEHAIDVANMLNAFGISCGVVHGKMPEAERDKVLLEFRNGVYQALSNNNILTTGYDNANVDMIVNLRPSKSPGLWVQILGRGTRCLYADGFDLNTADGRLAAIAASPKQNCLVLDFGGNTKRLGPINDPHLPKSKGKKGGEAITKDCEKCNTINHPSVRFCINCGEEFKFKVGIKTSASTDEIIKQDLPIVEEFKVDQITYAIHHKEGKPPMLRVTYYCGYAMYTDYVCFEHDGFALRKAKEWWRNRTEQPFPTSTEHALELAASIGTATSLRVWTNKKYPEVLAYCYDGSHFGKELSGSNSVEVIPPKLVAKNPTKAEIDKEYGDDIPF